LNEEIKIVFDDILISLHEACIFSIAMSILCTTIYIIIKECGIKNLVIEWKKREKRYRLLLLALCFYISLMLFRTLFNRDAWFNPFSNIIGIWGIHDLKGNITTESIENVVLFLPFAVLLSIFLKIEKNNIGHKALFKVVLKCSTLFSACLEIVQTLFRMGTFQLADLCYNIVGALMGYILYLFFYNVKEQKERKLINEH